MANPDDNGKKRIAVYQGNSWEMGPNTSPDNFLNAALVPHFPDLRGAKWTRTATAEEVRYEYSKQSGEKGLPL